MKILKEVGYFEHSAAEVRIEGAGAPAEVGARGERGYSNGED